MAETIELQLSRHYSGSVEDYTEGFGYMGDGFVLLKWTI